MRTLTPWVERGQVCPYSTSRVQLRTEGLTQPPMGPRHRRPSTQQPHEAPHIRRSEALTPVTSQPRHESLGPKWHYNTPSRSTKPHAPGARRRFHVRPRADRATRQVTGSTKITPKGARSTGSIMLLVTDGVLQPIRWNPPNRANPHRPRHVRGLPRTGGIFLMGPTPIGGAPAQAP